MFMLGDVYNAANDYAALCEDDTVEAVRRKIKAMLLRETADACNYCSAGSDAPGLIPAGRQPGKPLEMSAYTFVKREDLP